MVTVNYPAMSREEAQVTTLRRRQLTGVLRYRASDHAQVSTAEQLLELLDLISDEELAEFLELRRKRKQGNQPDKGNLGTVDAKPRPEATIGNTHTASIGSVVGKYAKRQSERALQYCLRAQEQGKHVDYSQVLADVRSGRLK